MPTALPPGMAHFPYVPFKALLPRLAALVHHGGIGTTSQALLAGVPQLVRPMGFDQFDNAKRESLALCPGAFLDVRGQSFAGPRGIRERT